MITEEQGLIGSLLSTLEVKESKIIRLTAENEQLKERIRCVMIFLNEISKTLNNDEQNRQ